MPSTIPRRPTTTRLRQSGTSCRVPLSRAGKWECPDAPAGSATIKQHHKHKLPLLLLVLLLLLLVLLLLQVSEAACCPSNSQVHVTWYTCQSQHVIGDSARRFLQHWILQACGADLLHDDDESDVDAASADLLPDDDAAPESLKSSWSSFSSLSSPSTVATCARSADSRFPC